MAVSKVNEYVRDVQQDLANIQAAIRLLQRVRADVGDEIAALELVCEELGQELDWRDA